MGEAPILDYCKPHPPPMGWRSEIVGAFVFGTVLGCAVAGFVISVIDFIHSQTLSDACSVFGGAALGGLILGLFGSVVLAIAMGIRARILRSQFQTPQTKTATWAGVLYPVSIIAPLFAIALGDLHLSEGYVLAIALGLLIWYPIVAAWVLVRPWGEVRGSGKLPAPVAVIEIEPTAEPGDVRPDDTDGREA